MPPLTTDPQGYCHRNHLLFEDPHYAAQFLAVTRQLLPRALSVTAVIDGWAELVAKVEAGYNATPPELEYALSTAREPIDALLMEGSLHAFAEHRKFIRAVQQLDTRFLELTFEAPLHPEDFTWYYRRVPLRAGPEYVDFLSGELKRKVERVGEK
jgi:hypothetical protein